MTCQLYGIVAGLTPTCVHNCRIWRISVGGNLLLFALMNCQQTAQDILPCKASAMWRLATQGTHSNVNFLHVPVTQLKEGWKILSFGSEAFCAQQMLRVMSDTLLQLCTFAEIHEFIGICGNGTLHRDQIVCIWLVGRHPQHHHLDGGHFQSALCGCISGLT